jgi:hypothetical protein
VATVTCKQKHRAFAKLRWYRYKNESLLAKVCGPSLKSEILKVGVLKHSKYTTKVVEDSLVCVLGCLYSISP